MDCSAQELSKHRDFLFGIMTYYQDNTEISKDEVTALMETNPKALEDWNKADTYFTISLVSTGLQLGATIYYIRQLTSLETTSVAPLYALAGFSVISITFDYLSRNARNRAILNYNHDLDAQSNLSLGVTPNGVGLVLSF